jgi:hypothetical protein
LHNAEERLPRLAYCDSFCDGGGLFTLIGGDGKTYGAFGYVSDPAMEANETRDIVKTFAVHQDAVEGAKLHVKDIFSDQGGVILLPK